jgi:crotonobetainyl-CoA:carnitine CoA-transferase CaiB-like acyl-CoA transferase
LLEFRRKPRLADSVGRKSIVARKALEGLTVLDYSTTLAGPYCTKLMADLGAEVVHVEPPRSGHIARTLLPFPGDIPHPEKSGIFLFLNTNKLGITLDPALPEGKNIFEQLVSRADVLVEDWPLGHMEQLGLGYPALKEIHPGLVMASIQPFGRSGPYKDFKAYQLNTSHVSGQAYLLPMPSPDLERAPVKMGGNTVDYDVGQMAAVGVLGALFSRGTTGRGQRVEVSRQEATLSHLRVELVVYANGGDVLRRTGRKGERITWMLPCKDGHVVSVTPLDHQKEAFRKLICDPEPSAPDSENGSQADGEDGAALSERVARWMRNRTADEICAKAQALSCPICAVSSPEQMTRSAQLNARGFFVDVNHPAAGKVRTPARAYHFSKTPLGITRPAPLLGQHNEEIYGRRLGYGLERLAELREADVI